MADWMKSPRGIAVLMLVLCAGILGGALFIEHVQKVKPCPLCYEQRTPWYLLLGLWAGILALPYLPGVPGRALIGLYLLSAVLGLWSVVLGGHHALVEFGILPAPPTCAAQGIASGDLTTLDPGEVVDCTKVAWTFLWISLAGYNVLASLFLTAISVFAGFRLFQVHRFLTRIVAFLTRLVPPRIAASAGAQL